jgi:hypothetical protein
MDDDPDWTEAWQVKLDTILLAQEALGMRDQYRSLETRLQKWMPKLLAKDGSMHPKPLGGVEAYWKAKT